MTSKFPERLRLAMDIRGIKQTDLVKETGISKSSISHYLSGEYIAKQDNTYKLAKALRVDQGWLMGGEGDMEPQISNLIEVTMKTVPYLGSIAGGEPLLVCEEI